LQFFITAINSFQSILFRQVKSNKSMNVKTIERYADCSLQNYLTGDD